MYNDYIFILFFIYSKYLTNYLTLHNFYVIQLKTESEHRTQITKQVNSYN